MKKPIWLMALVVLCGCARKPMRNIHEKQEFEFVQGYGWSEQPCGKVMQNYNAWRAFRYTRLVDTGDTERYFSTKEEAIAWLTTNWCKP